MINESPKQFWQRYGTVDYLRIETRPPRKRPKNDGRCQVIIESTPDGTLGGHDALEAIIRCKLRLATGEQARRFYAALKVFAEEWVP